LSLVEKKGKSKSAKNYEIISRQAIGFGHFGEFCQRHTLFWDFIRAGQTEKVEI
jgi:hypothetical protein